MPFKQIDIRDVKQNAVSLISDRWMLITAGDKAGYNMMTASWGTLGEMWKKDIVTAVVRPARYTLEFLEKQDYFTLSFFSGELSKRVHAVCGSKSGRDIDKTAQTGLTPIFDEGVYFEQADLVLVCKKIYVSDVDPEKFLDPALKDEIYPQNDYHRMFVGEIIKTLEKE